MSERGFDLCAEGPASVEFDGEWGDEAELVGVVGDIVVACREDGVGDEGERGSACWRLIGAVDVVAPEVDFYAETEVAHAGF